MSSSSAASETPTITVERFLRAILRSGLLSREQLQAALRGFPRDQREDPQALAEYLIRQGKLSRFQASKLLKGASSGLVVGPFQILSPLGKGGMGWVFLASDSRNQALVALKLLPPHRARNEERTLARFRREMDISQKVAHPHVAWTYEVGEHRGVHYIAMEYIPGKTLTRVVADEGPLPLARAARLLAEVALGLHHAHGRGLVHRDLKPSNIQVTPRDHAKILDLGLALFSGETEVDHMIVGGQGYIVGTMDYIAPEQTTDASQVGPRSDIYSLGCTLYFALAGQPPFPGGSSREKVQRHRSDEPIPLEHLRPDLPGPFVVLVRRLMHKDPEQRPASAQAVADLLNAWAAGSPPPQPDVEETAVDEAVLLESVGSAEFSVVSLPVLEIVAPEADEESESESVSAEMLLPLAEQLAARDEEAAASWAWTLFVLAAGLALVLGMVVLGLLLLLLRRP
jgi:serine/threonine protein kinase